MIQLSNPGAIELDTPGQTFAVLLNVQTAIRTNGRVAIKLFVARQSLVTQADEWECGSSIPFRVQEFSCDRAFSYMVLGQFLFYLSGPRILHGTNSFFWRHCRG